MLLVVSPPSDVNQDGVPTVYEFKTVSSMCGGYTAQVFQFCIVFFNAVHLRTSFVSPFSPPVATISIPSYQELSSHLGDNEALEIISTSLRGEG